MSHLFYCSRDFSQMPVCSSFPSVILRREGKKMEFVDYRLHLQSVDPYVLGNLQITD